MQLMFMGCCVLWLWSCGPARSNGGFHDELYISDHNVQKVNRTVVA